MVIGLLVVGSVLDLVLLDLRGVLDRRYSPPKVSSSEHSIELLSIFPQSTVWIDNVPERISVEAKEEGRRTRGCEEYEGYRC